MSQEQEESFYSLEQSKTEFTFLEEPEGESPKSNKLVKMLGIKQSSALEPESSSNQVNQTMQTIVMEQENQFHGLEMHDISGIDLREIHQLECSTCLEKEIKCLSVPSNPTLEDVRNLQVQIDTVFKQQSMLRRQIEVFQGLLSLSRSHNQDLIPSLITSGKIMKKKCQHSESMASPFNFDWPDPNQISIKTLNQPQESSQKSGNLSHCYDIKPPLERTPAEEKLNRLYKQASFKDHITLLEDYENQYRIEVSYFPQQVCISIINFSRGETNYLYAGKLNEGQQKISQKLIFPLKKYIEKKFTLSLNIVLLFFESNKPKTEEHLIKIEDIRSISVPLPLCYLIESRFEEQENLSFMEKILKKMYTYEIDINYRVDQESLNQIRSMIWAQQGWISLKGSDQLIKVRIDQSQEVKGQNTTVFKVSTARKDAQEAIDLIEYLCFMLTL